jgi:hypothetical protein
VGSQRLWRLALGELAARTAATAARMAARATATELLNDPPCLPLQQLDDGHRIELRQRVHPEPPRRSGGSGRHPTRRDRPNDLGAYRRGQQRHHFSRGLPAGDDIASPARTPVTPTHLSPAAVWPV